MPGALLKGVWCVGGYLGVEEILLEEWKFKGVWVGSVPTAPCLAPPLEG